MDEIKFEPIGSRKLTSVQKRDARIQRLKYWIRVLAAADIIYTTLAIVMIYQEIVR